MKLKTIWVRTGLKIGDDPAWCVGAWDEYSIDENPEGYEEALEHENNEHGVENVRIVTLTFDGGAVERAFDDPPAEPAQVVT